MNNNEIISNIANAHLIYIFPWDKGSTFSANVDKKMLWADWCESNGGK